MNVFHKLQSFFTERREQRALREYARGYQFAAGALLVGDTVDSLKLKTSNARFDGKFTPFDRGIEQACLAWTAHIRKLRQKAFR